MKTKKQARSDAGFSLIELMIAMAVTVFVMSLAAALLSSSVNVRAREDRRTDAIAEVRRALSVMTREIGNAGYQLPSNLAGNGIIAADSNSSQIRIVTNSDRFSTAPGATPYAVSSQDEDVIYQFVNNAGADQSYILRYDVNSAVAGTSVLANRIDAMVIRYFDQRVTYQSGTCQEGIRMSSVRNAAGTLQGEVAPSQASYVVISVCVSLPRVGTIGTPGYEPASRTQMITDVQLRNANIKNY
jgi:prepilin-type N-terminal cleavage/methylation domain-containing protein